MSEDAKPWDMFNGSERASDQLIDIRYNMCVRCEFFKPVTKRCSQCGCFMKLKTTILKASCPKGKW